MTANTLPSQAFQGRLIAPYQTQGVKWMIHKEACHPPGGVLCDEMGLGKTVQMLYTVCSNINKYPSTLIVLQSPLLDNGYKKLKTTNLSYYVHSNKKTTPNLSTYKVVLYVQQPAVPCCLYQQNWSRVILDEGHTRNPKRLYIVTL